MGDAEPDRRAQVEPPAAPARALATREPRPHHPRETFGQLNGSGALPIPYECRDVLPGHRLLRRRASMSPAAISRSAFGSSAAADVGRLMPLIVRAGAMLETAGRAGGERLGADLHGALHATPAPKRVEQFVEPRKLRPA